MGMIDSPDNGATEVPGTSHNSLMVFLAGPIRYWWTPGIEGTRLHTLYMKQRDIVHKSLSEDYLVYAPHRAVRGPWDKRAQRINDGALITCDVFVWIEVDGVPAQGTQDELWLAKRRSMPCFPIYIGDSYSVNDQLTELKRILNSINEARRSE